MAAFEEVLRALFLILMVQLGIILVGNTITLPPPQTSLLALPSSCAVTDFGYYQTIPLLQHYQVLAIFSSACLTCTVKYRTTAATDKLAATRRLRVFSFVTVVLSLASAVLSAVISFYILQVKVCLWACFSEAAKACVYASYVMMGLVCAVTYYELASVAIWSE